MGSRMLIQEQNNRGEAVPGALKQKNMAVERKNPRRVLGDIGNLDTKVVVDGKPSRPVTRAYCAQLQAKAREAGNVKPVLGEVVPAKKPAAVRVRAVKKVVTKQPKAREIIVIPDSVESKDKGKAEEMSVRKNAPTLTSTLTARSKDACGLRKKPKGQVIDIDEADLNNDLARSKDACGLRKKPKGQVIDIDEADLNNDLAVVEYVEDMYKFYKSVENESRPHDYIHSQPELNEKMRAILIDWLVQIHLKFELSPETLYLTINIVDRYLASKTTARRDLQLVGMSSMLIASKYEEIWAPEVNDLVNISASSYSDVQVLVMEKKILGALEWYLTVPTPYVFLVRFIKASMTDSDVENMVFFLAELGMMNYETLIYCPSMLAAAAVYAARCTLHKTPLWNDTLKKHTGFTEEQIMDCAKLLATFHSVASDEDQRLKGIYRKYTSSERGAVALMPPAESLLGSMSS